MPPKTAFSFGFVTAILTLGTLGFIILGSCLLNGSCAAGSPAKSVGTGTVAAGAPVAAAPTPAAIPAGKVPVVSDSDHIRGDKNAKLTLVEYSDFQCPYCGAFAPTVDQILEANKDVRLVYRHFPLSFHPNAMPAAEAAECAGEQGKFWEFHDILFANQDSLGEDFYKKTAGDLGLNVTKFEDCRSSDRLLAKVQKDAQEGGAAGVSGTPGSFLIDANGNAQAIKGALPAASIQAMIDAARAAK